MDGESQKEQDARVERLWQTLDTAKDGHLDLKGLKKGLKKIDHPLRNADNFLQEVLHTVDTNGDGIIQYSEFRTFVAETENKLWLLFKSIDRDHNGKLDEAELKVAFKRAGLDISASKFEEFFAEIDANHDGLITFDEWRNFLLFIPTRAISLKAVLSYYSSTVTINSEGDVHVSDEIAKGLGYFLAGGIAGVVSRTATAPLDRLKVYLIAQTSVTAKTLKAVKSGAPVEATKLAARPLADAALALWGMGGVRSLFAGNGLNIIKVMPESAIKFGSYEGTRRIMAQLEGHNDPKGLSGMAQFFSAGMGGMISQLVIYPLDTLKFRMQCETVKGGLRGNALIFATAKKMFTSGSSSFYRGLNMGLIGMFPYSAIDLTTYEYLKHFLTARKATTLNVSRDDPCAAPGKMVTGGIGALSSSFGASAVYPLNLLRTRLQSQGTAIHTPTYTGWRDCMAKTVKNEGVRGLYKGLTPNLLKVVPSMSITYIVYEYSKKMLVLQ